MLVDRVLAALCHICAQGEMHSSAARGDSRREGSTVSQSCTFTLPTMLVRHLSRRAALAAGWAHFAPGSPAPATPPCLPCSVCVVGPCATQPLAAARSFASAAKGITGGSSGGGKEAFVCTSCGMDHSKARKRCRAVHCCLRCRHTAFVALPRVGAAWVGAWQSEAG